MIDPDVLKKLEALGIKPGEAKWIETQPVEVGELPTVQKQRELLAKLRELLQSELQDSQAKLEMAREQLERLKNGGGA